MKKLSLDLGSLRVETFTTADAEAKRGTVAAHDATNRTCGFSCPATCGIIPDDTSTCRAVTQPDCQCV
ncbi:MAG TPA: hypothetical protein VF092_24245 [Longimicrobium sp.]